MTPRFSVLIPTLNEADHIGATLAAATRALGDDAELILSDGGSTDATMEVAADYNPRVVTGAPGRGTQLNAALAVAEGEVCILLHADTLLPGDAAAQIQQVLKSAVGGAFMLRFDGEQLSWLARAINLRSRFFNTATGDQAIFAKRDVLMTIGGVPEVELFEDVRLWQQLKRAGRVTVVSSKVTTSARLWHRFGTWRIILLHLRLRALHRMGVPPRRLAEMYPTSGR